MKIDAPSRRTLGIALLVNTAGGVVPTLFAFVYRAHVSGTFLWNSCFTPSFILIASEPRVF